MEELKPDEATEPVVSYPRLLWHATTHREYVVTNRDDEAELRARVADLVDTPPMVEKE